MGFDARGCHMSERIFDIYWEGPFKWGEHEDKLDECHVLYAFFGSHPAHGSNVLLYIGMTEWINNRMRVHAEWIEEEYDIASIRVASMGEISSWAGWDDIPRYEKADLNDIKSAEALLIYAHQPIYNRSSKDTLAIAKGLRIFNTGKIGSLLPEVSYRYHNNGKPPRMVGKREAMSWIIGGGSGWISKVSPAHLLVK
jgi:hypothetical protein